MSNSTPQLVSAILLAPRLDSHLRLSVSYFLRQTYPERELIVVLPASESVNAKELTSDPAVKVASVSPAAKPSERLLAAVAMCRGQYLAWWDPFDWVGRERLGEQVRALSASGGGVCIAETIFGYHPVQARAWRCAEDPPGGLARKTWCCNRSLAHASGSEQILSRLADDPQQYFDNTTAARIAAPWYVWILSAPGPLDVDRRHVCMQPVTAGEVTGIMWTDRESYVAQRVRHRAPHERRPRPVPTGCPAAAALPALRERVRSAAINKPGRISCLMPTYNRRAYIGHAVQCFLEQDYSNRELVIVDDGTESVEEIVSSDPRIIYLRLRSRKSIGVKRNLAMEIATGEYLMCWDDDDWSGPGRISYQLAPLVAGRCDATALSTGFILDQSENQLWSKAADRSGILFQSGVNWGTLAWTRASQRGLVRFPDSSLCEDVAFKNELVRHGARLQALENRGVYVYVRHGANTWRFDEEKMLLADRWQRIPRPAFLPQRTLDFYHLNRQQAQLSRM